MIPNPYEQRQYGVQRNGVLSEDQGIAPLALAGAGLLGVQGDTGQPQTQVQTIRTSPNPYSYGNGDEFWNPRNAHSLGRITDQMGPFIGGLAKMTMMRGDNLTFNGKGFENVDQPIQTYRNYLSDNLGGDWAKLNTSREPKVEELL
jgi:hypothetical protein